MPTHTVMFVDVDGVLNVGLSQGDNNTLMLSCRNIALARRVQLDLRASKASRDAAESLFNLAAAPLDGEAGTLQKFICPDHGISDVLVERLAKLILAAGQHVHVVLSSSWRHERHLAKRQLLEKKISKCLGRSWQFDAVTDTERKEHTGGDRLEIMGEYLQEYSHQIPKDEPLRVLVLDDFFLCPMGWTLEGKYIETPQDMDEYLLSRISDRSIKVKTVYTYDEWMMRLGKIKASIGLQMNMYREALNFLHDKVEVQMDIPETRTALLLKTASVLPIKKGPTTLCPCQSVILAL